MRCRKCLADVQEVNQYGLCEACASKIEYENSLYSSDFEVEKKRPEKEGPIEIKQSEVHSEKFFLTVLRYIFAIPISCAAFFLLDFLSPYAARLIDVLYGYEPNGLLTMLWDYGACAVLAPILSVYLLIVLFGKIFPVSRVKHSVAVLYMTALCILSCFNLYRYIIDPNPLTVGIVKFSVYVVVCFFALIYAVKSKEAVE